MLRAERELFAELERTPTDEELASAPKLPVKQVREVHSAARAVTSLDKPLGDEGSSSFGDLFASDEPHARRRGRGASSPRRALHRAVAELPDREQEVVKLRYGLGDTAEPKSLEEIGRMIGITRERVRQIEAEALRQPRRAARVRRDSLPA